jgi:hypothetical protein
MLSAGFFLTAQTNSQTKRAVVSVKCKKSVDSPYNRIYTRASCWGIDVNQKEEGDNGKKKEKGREESNKAEKSSKEESTSKEEGNEETRKAQVDFVAAK